MNYNKIDRKIKINVRKKMIPKRGGGVKKMISRKNIHPWIKLQSLDLETNQNNIHIYLP